MLGDALRALLSRETQRFEGDAMALGAYSLVRYSNELNDQRVNLGVLLWHPQDGFRSYVVFFF